MQICCKYSQARNSWWWFSKAPRRRSSSINTGVRRRHICTPLSSTLLVHWRQTPIRSAVSYPIGSSSSSSILIHTLVDTNGIWDTRQYDSWTYLLLKNHEIFDFFRPERSTTRSWTTLNRPQIIKVRRLTSKSVRILQSANIIWLFIISW